MTDVSFFDRDRQFHEEWLGLAQPMEGLVFSLPVLIDAQIRPRVTAQLTAQLEALVVDQPAGATFPELPHFFREFLGYRTPGMMVERSSLDAALSFYAPEGGQELRPSFALARGPFAPPHHDDPFAEFDPPNHDDPFAEFDPPRADHDRQPPAHAPAPAPAHAHVDAEASPYWALVWDLRDDAPRSEQDRPLSLDKPEDCTGPWRYPPTAKLERLLRHTGIPIGLLCNGDELRLLYAPKAESSAHLTFRLPTLREPAGRPVLAALQLLLNASRAHTAAPAHTLEGLLQESRRRQADVTRDLAQQVFEAVEILLEGFEQAAARDSSPPRLDWLQAALHEGGDHFYQGVLSVVLRLVFLLYAEDQGLLPIDNEFYAEHLSIFGLFAQLRDDSSAHPESMHHRFGAYGRLLALFRAVYLGVKHGTLELPPRRGKLFDPAAYPFLEGGMPGSSAAIVLAEQRAAARPPSIDDGSLFRVLHRLIVFQGQRLSYRSLDVEQLGSVYESLMGYHVLKTSSPAVRVGPQSVWVELDKLDALSPTDRKRLWKESCGLNPGPVESLEQALIHAGPHDDSRLEALSAYSPGRKTDRPRHRVGSGRLVLQPGEERRRTGSHYTPRALTEKIVRRTLEPLLACLGERPSAEQLLQLNICDPAMGSGAFLVAACRQLADQVVAAWTAHGQLSAIAEAHADPHLHARRLVAQRCLYGVDKNPAAVELAKLSLWLETMSRTLPFTFVDHALRHGDSLVGLDFTQLRAFHWQPVKQLDFTEVVLADALEQAVQLRSELLQLADADDAVSLGKKRRLLDFADQSMAKIRLIADLCVGAFFSADSEAARKAERERRLDLCRAWLGGNEQLEPLLRELAHTTRTAHAPFHWVLEFPEVFFDGRKDPLAKWKPHPGACMDAVVGNPPFAGKNTITDANGANYLDWLKALHREAHGNSDLSAHFFRRAATLLGQNGAFGLIATNTIAQGDTRTTGLAALVAQGWSIYDATNSLPWPGAAAVTVSVVHAAVGTPSGHVEKVLDGRRVEAIDSMLKVGQERGQALPLLANVGCAFVGSYVLGMGFTLTPDERNTLVKQNPHNAERIFPYLGGQEVNSSPTQHFDRYVINFGQLSLEQAQAWPDLLAIVREKVKPERDRNNRANYRDSWWLFGEYRPGLYTALQPLQRCLVTARVTKHLCFSFQPTDWIFSEALNVFPLDTYSAFGILQSRIHEVWARLLSSSLEDRLRYTASDCFETFPFPERDPRTVLEALERIGSRLYEARARYMGETEQGLTKTYNALKDPGCEEGRILELRRLHEELDRAVLSAYGWDGGEATLEVPPYCPKTPGEKAAEQAFREEVIERLYALNAKRAQEEKLAGSTGAKKGGKKGKAGEKASEKASEKAGEKAGEKAAGKGGWGPLFGG